MEIDCGNNDEPALSHILTCNSYAKFEYLEDFLRDATKFNSVRDNLRRIHSDDLQAFTLQCLQRIFVDDFSKLYASPSKGPENVFWRFTGTKTFEAIAEAGKLKFGGNLNLEQCQQAMFFAVQHFFAENPLLLTIFHLNINSLKNKIDKLKKLLRNYVIHIICLTEHRMKEIDMKDLTIANYKVATYFCRSTNAYGGSCILVTNGLLQSFCEIDVKNYQKDEEFEICGIELKNAQIYCLYRPPINEKRPFNTPKKFLQNLEEFLNFEKLEGKKIIIAGDFNIDMRGSSPNAFLKLFEDYGFTKFIDEPTFASKSHIDHIFVKNFGNSKIEAENCDCQLSDHFGQLLKVDTRGTDLEPFLGF